MKRRISLSLGALRRSVDSVGGRTFALLTVGITAAAVLSLALTEDSRRKGFEELRSSQLISRVAQLQQRWASTPVADRSAVINRLPGIMPLIGNPDFVGDAEMQDRLEQALGKVNTPLIGQASGTVCLPPGADPIDMSSTSASISFRVECWVVSLQPPGEARNSFAMLQPALVMPLWAPQNQIYLLLMLAASALLSVLVARFVTRPLRRLADAATAFADSLDAQDADVSGPTEVKAALSTFNIMQARVRSGLHERTQLLAAISHDLQTPLTRLRLRLEQVQDDALRERLVSDVNATQALVREGLDLARSHETTEPWSVVDIDSLLESLAEDAAEFGADVKFLGGCGASLRVKPNALARALNNLIDNAVSYGNSAELSCRVERTRVLIRIRDHGPGLPDPDDERLFEPFVRGQTPSTASRRGTGIGLTIARAQAAASGATVKLANHAAGGLIASVSLPVGLQ